MKFTLKLWKDDMGTFSQPGCRNAEDALWHVNSARYHDGLRPLTLDELNEALQHAKNSSFRAEMIEEP